MKRRRILIFWVGVLLAAGAWLLLAHSGEPRYEGKTVSYWFREYCLRAEGKRSSFRRREITNALFHIGTNALPYLTGEVLSTRKDTVLRNGFYGLLGEFPESWHLPQNVSREEMRRRAGELITQMRPDGEIVLPLVRKSVESGNPDVRYRALTILCHSKGGNEMLAPIFARALQYSDSDSRRVAISYFGYFNTSPVGVVPGLSALLEQTNDDLDLEAAVLLGNLGPNAIDAASDLRRQFERQTNWLRKACFASALCRIGTNNPCALTFLIDGLRHTNICDFMTIRLGDGIEYLTEAPEFLAKDLSEHGSEAGVAAYELAQIGTNAAIAIPALEHALSNSNMTRWNDLPEIFNALELVGSRNPSVRQIFHDDLRSDNDFIRFQAAEQLMKIDISDPAVTETLGDLTQQGSYIADFAIDDLRKMGSAAKGAIPELLKLVRDTNDVNWPSRLESVTRTLVELGAPSQEYLPLIEARLSEPAVLASDQDGYWVAKAILDVEPANRQAQTALANLVFRKASSQDFSFKNTLDALVTAGQLTPDAKSILAAAVGKLKGNGKLDESDVIEEAMDQAAARGKGEK